MSEGAKKMKNIWGEEKKKLANQGRKGWGSERAEIAQFTSTTEDDRT